MLKKILFPIVGFILLGIIILLGINASIIAKSSNYIVDVNVSNDEADAICIGHYGVNHHKKQVELIEW